MNIFKVINTGKNVLSSLNSNKLQNELNYIHYRSFLADNLNKYSEQFNQLKCETEPKLQKIASNASIVYGDVLNAIDCYDNNRGVLNETSKLHSKEHLRHIANKIVMLWYHKYSCNLGNSWSGLIFRDMLEILHVKPEEENRGIETKIHIVKKNFESIVERLNFTNEGLSKPSRSAYSHPELFNSLLFAYFNRVSGSQKLYEDSIKIARPVFDEVLSLQDLFQNNCIAIESWIKENELEIVKIHEFPELYNSLIKYKACMMFLSEFFLFDSNIRLEAEHLRMNQVLEILFCLFVLKIYGAWGNSHYFPV